MTWSNESLVHDGARKTKRCPDCDYATGRSKDIKLHLKSGCPWREKNRPRDYYKRLTEDERKRIVEKYDSLKCTTQAKAAEELGIKLSRLHQILAKQRKITGEQKQSKWTEERRKRTEARQKGIIEKYDSLPYMPRAQAAEELGVKLSSLNSILAKQRQLTGGLPKQEQRQKRKKWTEERRKVIIEEYYSMQNMSQAEAAKKLGVN